MGWTGIAVIFAAVWLWAFYREDRHEREPFWMIAFALGWGGLAIVPALWLEAHLLPAGLGPEDRLAVRAAGLLLVVGPVEELCKFMLKAPAVATNGVKEYLRHAMTMDVPSAVDLARNLHAVVNSSSEMRRPK